MDMDRREFLRRGAGGAALTLAFGVGGSTLLLTPEEARARQLPWGRLGSTDSARALRGRVARPLASTLCTALGLAEGKLPSSSGWLFERAASDETIMAARTRAGSALSSAAGGPPSKNVSPSHSP